MLWVSHSHGYHTLKVSRQNLESTEVETKALFVLVYDLYEYIWFLCNDDTVFISHGLQLKPPLPCTLLPSLLFT